MKKLIVCMAMILLVLSITLILIRNAKADGNGNYPAPENGDWIISEETNVWNEKIVLNGSLFIENNGKLTFNNVTLIMDCKEIGEFKIQVNSTGEFYIFDYDNDPKTTFDRSNITANISIFKFAFLVKSDTKFEMRNSELSSCGYRAGDGRAGLTIKTTNAIIDNSTFYNNYRSIFLNTTSSNNNIITNNIFFNNNYGVCLNFSNNNLIENNEIYSNQEIGIRLWSSTDNTILNNNISDNNFGIYTKYSDSIFENNTITNNKWDGIFNSNSNSFIINNSISNNGEKGLSFYQSSSKIMLNKIFNHNKIGIYSHNSTTIIEDNIIIENKNGIFCNLGMIEIIDNNISENTNGIYVNYSYPWISNNRIFNNKYGILSYSYSEPNIIENIIFNNKYGIFSDSSSYFDILNCEIRNNDYGIYVSKTSKLTLINNIISDNRINGIYIGEYSFTNWEINSDSAIRNNTISLRGETVILNGGNLILSNSTIIMKPSSYSIINVHGGGSLSIFYTNITSNKPSRRFKFRVQNKAKLIMRNSELHYCGYDEFYGGLTLESDDVILEDNEFTNNFYGIYCYYTSPIIKNNTFSDNVEYGIYCYYSNATIVDNIFFNNSNGIMISSSNPYIKNNQIFGNKNNGIVVYSKDSRMEIINCLISNNSKGIYTDFQASPILINCTISDDLYLDSRSQIVTINTTFKDVNFGDQNSTLVVNWFLHLKVISPNRNAVPNANIHFQGPEYDKRFITSEDGIKKWILLSEYYKSKDNTQLFFYSINLSKDNIYNISTHNIEKTKWLTLYLEDIISPQIFDVNIYDITDHSVLISWKTNEKSDSIVKYGKDLNFSMIEQNNNISYYHTILLKDLDDDTNYNFTVISKDENGNSNSSANYFFTTKKDLIPPNPIKNLKAIDTKKGGEIELIWDVSDANDFARYNIYTVEQEIMFTIGTLNEITQTSFLVKSLTDGKKYYFAVTAQDKNGNENKSVDIIEAVPTFVNTETKFTVEVIDIDFPNKTNDGKEIKINITIENIGNEILNDIIVEFYFGEKFIGKKIPSIVLEKGEKAEIYLLWKTEKGKDKIKIILKNSNNETLGEIYESDDWMEVVANESSVNYSFLLIFILLIIIIIFVFTVPKKGRNQKNNVKTEEKYKD